MQHDGIRLQQAGKKIGRFASDRKQLAAVDEMQFRFGRDIALRCPDAAARRPYLFLRQGRADFVTVRQGAEQRGLLFGQHAGQPMPHARQQMFAPGRALKFPLPERMIGKDHLRALREFVRQPLAQQISLLRIRWGEGVRRTDEVSLAGAG